MTILLSIIGFAAFIYVVVRLGHIEEDIEELKRHSEKTSGQVVTQDVSNEESRPSETFVPTSTASLPASAPFSPAIAAQVLPTTPVPMPISPESSLSSDIIKKPDESNQSEFNLGSKVFTAVGVVALLLGVGFFLRYAFENNIITPFARVMLGVVSGIALSVGGDFLRKKFVTYGSTLFGAGLGIIYISIYSAYAFYGLIGLPMAFLFLLIVTSIGVSLALVYDSLPLVSFSFVGAFIIPFVLPITVTIHILFVYLLVLSLAVLLISYFKNWSGLTVGSLFGVFFVVLRFLADTSSLDLKIQTMSYITLIFVIFFFANLISFLSKSPDEIQTGKNNPSESVLISAVPFLYFILGTIVLQVQSDIATFLFFISIFYLAGSFLVRTFFAENVSSVSFSNLMLLIGSLALVGSTALHFNGSSTTVLWALESIVLIAVGYVLRASFTRIFGLILPIFVFLRMIGTDMDLGSGSVAIFNSRAMIFSAVFLAYISIWYLYRLLINKDVKDISENEITSGKFIGSVGIFLVPFVWICLEINNFIAYPYIYLPIAWMVFLSLMVSVGFLAKDMLIRVLSYILLMISFVGILVNTWTLPAALYLPLFNIRVFTATVCVVVSAYIVAMFKTNSANIIEEEKPVKNFILVIANVMTLWVFSVEISDYFNSGTVLDSSENTKRVLLSAYWLFYAIAGLFVGIVKRSIFARYLSIVLFSIVILKIFLYDTANFSDVYRFVSFIILGVILLIAGYSYYRFKDRITSFVKVGD